MKKFTSNETTQWAFRTVSRTYGILLNIIIGALILFMLLSLADRVFDIQWLDNAMNVCGESLRTFVPWNNRDASAYASETYVFAMTPATNVISNLFG